MDSIKQIYSLRNVYISLVYIIYKQYTVSVTVMDMMEESETLISTVFSVCLQLVGFTWTRSVGSTEVQCLHNYETVMFSVSGIVHKLANWATLSGFICPQWQHVRSRTTAAALQWIWNIVQTPESSTSSWSPRDDAGWNDGTVGLHLSLYEGGGKKHSSCGKMQTVQLITLKDWKRNNKCWCCGSSHPPESYHIVLLYCMPVLEAMLDQGSKERSRDWAWRYNLWGREQGLRLAIAEPMCWI